MVDRVCTNKQGVDLEGWMDGMRSFCGLRVLLCMMRLAYR